MNRRRFLKTTAGLLVPSYVAKGSPGLPYFAGLRNVPLSAGNGLLSGLTSYWKFDEAAGASAIDSIGVNTMADGNNNVGRLAGGLINSARGSFAASGGGTDFLAPSSPSLQVGVGVSYTVFGWVSLTSLGLTEGIFTKWSGGGDNEYLLLTNSLGGGNSALQVQFTRVGGANVTINALANLTIGGWWFWCFGYDDATQLAFLRYAPPLGSLVARITASAAGGIKSGNDSLYVGNTAWGAILHGYVDEFGFYRRALSDTEIATIYNSGLGIPLSSYT